MNFKLVSFLFFARAHSSVSLSLFLPRRAPRHASPPADPDTCRPSSTVVPRSPSARPYPSPRPCSSFPPLPSRARAEQSRPPPPPTLSPPSIPHLRSVSPRFLTWGPPSHSPPPIPTLIRPWASLCRAAAALLRPPPPIAVAPPPRRRSSPAPPPVRLAASSLSPCAPPLARSGLAPSRRHPPAPLRVRATCVGVPRRGVKASLGLDPALWCRPTPWAHLLVAGVAALGWI